MTMADDLVLAKASNLKKNWGWFLALGISLIVLGIVAIGATPIVTMATVWFFGLLILMGGILHIAHAFVIHKWGGFLLELLLGILYLVIGYVICVNPLAGSALLTLVMGIAFLFNGGSRIALSIMNRDKKAWGLMLFSGLISVILGGMILAHWPVISLFIIGLFVAIELIFNGIFWLTMAVAVGAEN